MADEGFEYQESVKEALEAFFTDPSKENLPGILQADTEYDYLDFKREWHDRSQVARDILAFANKGGGAIVVGVEEDEDGELTSVGLSDPWDPSTFGNKIDKYLPDSVYDRYALETLQYGDVYDDVISGKTFQVLLIEDGGEAIPLVATADGKNIDEGFIYVRRHASSEVASYEEVQDLIGQRFERGVQQETAELHEELRQLKTLYGEIQKTKTVSKLTSGIVPVLSGLFETERNPTFPDVDYEQFVVQAIEKKQIKIERRLGIDSIQLER